jgi:hypothetical protein
VLAFTLIAAGASPEGVVVEDAAVSDHPTELEFGLLNTVGSPAQLFRFKAEGVGSKQVHGNDREQ